MGRTAYTIDSVEVANAILKRCFKRKLPITFGQLEKATLRVEMLCITRAGQHAIIDYVYPSITDKVSTVDLAASVEKYIPRAAGPKSAVKPRRGTELGRSIKQVVNEHHKALKGGRHASVQPGV